MVARILTAGLCLLLGVGCAKSTAKKPPPDVSASATPAPAETHDGSKRKNAKEDSPNWLNDPRFKKSSDGSTGVGESGSKKPWGLSPPKGGWQGATPGQSGQPQPAAPPGTGVLQPQPGNQPATTPEMKFSPVTRQDMFDLQVFIHDASLAAGKMPAPVLIYQALVAAGSPTAKLVKDGSIILTGATQRDAIWAFETRAILHGGFAVSQNGVETLTAAQLKTRLGK